MLPCRGRFNFYYGLAVSLVLHASIALPFVWLSLHKPAQHKLSKLRIELFGMVADRQMVEKRIQQNASPRPQPQQVNKPRPRKPPATYKAVVTESPVHVARVEEKEKPSQIEQVLQPKQASAAPLPAAPNSSGADTVQQRQQTIRSTAESESDRRTKYATGVVKAILNHLVYPEEVRRKGIEGVTTITFIITESGHLKGDSLRVKKSSGYAAMDANALNAVRASAPFATPPTKEFSITFDVWFTVNMARRSRTTSAAVH
jgi:protein TonB